MLTVHERCHSIAPPRRQAVRTPVPGRAPAVRSQASGDTGTVRGGVECPIQTRHRSLIVPALVLACFTLSLRAADTLPARLSDEEFWRMVVDLSEPPGAFQFENFVSNEITFQRVIPELKKTVRPHGAYLGVGPEQNFTYIAALEPKIAFIIDIRRQNMLEQLLYKALFELSNDRADFVSRLFSRPRPSGLHKASTADQLFRAFKYYFPDPRLFDRTLKEVERTLTVVHHLPLTMADREAIETIFKTFREGGPSISYAFDGRAPGLNSNHTYAALMTATDEDGVQWSYLATEDHFRRVQEMQRKNLIVPLVGDFAGPKTLLAVGAYLKAHGAKVSVFYASNVEEYIRKPLGNYTRFCSSVASLPVDAASSFIRWTSGTAPWTFLSSMTEFIDAFTGGRALPFEVRAANRRVLARISCN